MADEIAGTAETVPVENTGENVGESAAPQTQGAGESAPQGQQAEGNSAPAKQNETENKPEQSPEMNAIAAAARREAEKVARDLAKRQDEFAKGFGFKTFDELTKAQQVAAKEAKRQATIKETGLDPNVIEPIVKEIISANPAFQAVTAENGQAKISGAISELNGEFPELGVKTAEDLDNLPNADKIAVYIQRGNSLVDAYKLANWSDIQSGKMAAAKQAAINNINSKAHINPTGAATEPDNYEIPDETMRYYKAFFPHKTEDEIRAMDAKMRKGS